MDPTGSPYLAAHPGGGRHYYAHNHHVRVALALP